MPFFFHQVSYTKEAWARLMENPQDRLDAVCAPIEKLGGKLHTFYALENKGCQPSVHRTYFTGKYYLYFSGQANPEAF
jgi:hypothetical protein